MTLDALNQLPSTGAHDGFPRCRGSKRWASLMTDARPFLGYDALLAIAERTWWPLDAADWLEAFATHPRIGERVTSTSSSKQRSVAAASPSANVSARLAEGNRAYEQRFGYTFLVYATGLSAAELLAVLERRLAAHVADELQVAAAQQRKITALRLEKWLHS